MILINRHFGIRISIQWFKNIRKKMKYDFRLSQIIFCVILNASIRYNNNTHTTRVKYIWVTHIQITRYRSVGKYKERKKNIFHTSWLLKSRITGIYCLVSVCARLCILLLTIALSIRICIYVFVVHNSHQTYIYVKNGKAIKRVYNKLRVQPFFVSLFIYYWYVC